MLPGQYSVLSTGVLTTHGSYRTVLLELLTAVGTGRDTQRPALYGSKGIFLKCLSKAILPPLLPLASKDTPMPATNFHVSHASHNKVPRSCPVPLFFPQRLGFYFTLSHFQLV